jgi:hypothetical protein
MIHNEAEYNQMLSDQCQYEAEAAIRADYEHMLRHDAIQFLTEFYSSEPDESCEAENLIILVSYAFEWMDSKKLKEKKK